MEPDARQGAALLGLNPHAVVIFPGPCTPNDAGISIAAIRELSGVSVAFAAEP